MRLHWRKAAAQRAIKTKLGGKRSGCKSATKKNEKTLGVWAVACKAQTNQKSHRYHKETEESQSEKKNPIIKRATKMAVRTQFQKFTNARDNLGNNTFLLRLIRRARRERHNGPILRYSPSLLPTFPSFPLNNTLFHSFIKTRDPLFLFFKERWK